MNMEHQTTKSWRTTLGALAIGLVLSSGAQTNSNTNSAANEYPWPTYETFNVIQRNNIFDPNRRPWTRPPTDTGRIRTQIEGFALRGTMSYAKGRFAFFDGTTGDYNKVLEVGGNIAGYTVKEITQSDVTLGANGKDFKLKVGIQVRKQNGTWQMGRPIEATSDDTNGDEAADGTPVNDPTAVPAGANAQQSDILKRLMQAKEQELKEIK